MFGRTRVDACWLEAARLGGRQAWVGYLAALLIAGNGALAAVADDPPRYNRDVRPILTEHCFACHGPDAAQRQADLRLDNREAALAAGALDPQEWSASELLARIESTDPDLVMPVVPASSEEMVVVTPVSVVMALLAIAVPASVTVPLPCTV